MADLKKQLEGRTFTPLDDVNLFAGHFMGKRNLAPIADFHGLTSEQMHRFLYFPLDSPHLGQLPDLSRRDMN